MAYQFAELGAKVTVVDINVKGAEDTVKAIKQKGGQAVSFKCDVTSVQGMSLVFRICLNI